MSLASIFNLQHRNVVGPDMRIPMDGQKKAASKIPPVPAPSHRHAMPSGPWPWMDLDSEVDPQQLAKEHQPQIECDHKACTECWVGYPQSLFGNWTPDQVKRSRITSVINPAAADMITGGKGDPTAVQHKNNHCTIYTVDMDKQGRVFNARDEAVSHSNKEAFWEKLIRSAEPDNLRVRCYFLDNMTGPVLQILGTKFNIEPFFFSSSLSWIPCRYQEDLHAGDRDHITVTLTFLRMMHKSMTRPSSLASGHESASATVEGIEEPPPEHGVIETQSPLFLRSSDKILLLDLLAIHMVRNKHNCTIISFHPTREWHGTSARRLWNRVRFAGQSVYWQKIFEKTEDATFLLLAIIWHALYAWDEALETLYAHICWLEARVISTNDTKQTQELHIIRAHLLHWESLLDDLRKAVTFVFDTPNPVMESYPKDERDDSRKLMEKECNNLLSEILRMEKSRSMQDKRLKNVLNLVFSTVNMEDSKQMRKLTQAAVRDSAAMKQVSYLTMVFLPATFVAGIFGMNVREINPGSFGTLAHYAATAISFTVFTIYLIVAVQSKHYRGQQDTPIWVRLAWPVTFMKRSFISWKQDKKEPVKSDSKFGMTGFSDGTPNEEMDGWP